MPTPSEIVAQYNDLKLHEANEAETRLKVINDVLYSVLGWTHSDVHVEQRVSEDGSTTWADYVLKTGMTALVVEAKKVGVTFDEIPDARRAQLKGKLLKGATGDAIRQARDYARKLSIPFAVVTNGNSWVIFPATRVDQVAFEESSAIVFSTLKSALQDDYAEFFDLLSRQAVIDGSLENELLGRIENQISIQVSFLDAETF
jgi:predicted type IV restriction endonuclease